MAHGVVHFFPGGTQDQYEASIGAVHPSRKQLPPGQLHHAAGPTEGGWLVTVIYESKEEWEKFRNEVLMPKMMAGVPGGFAAPPEERTFEVHLRLP